MADFLDILALLPRDKDISLEEMLERAFKAKTGRTMTDAEWERYAPLLEKVRHLRPVHTTYGRRKWVG